jgi:hypothetical protein
MVRSRFVFQAFAVELSCVGGMTLSFLRKEEETWDSNGLFDSGNIVFPLDSY